MCSIFSGSFKGGFSLEDQMARKEPGQFVNTLRENDIASGVFQVVDARIIKNYLDLKLGDKTGYIPMKVWEWRENDEELGFLAVKGEKVRINGIRVEIFDGRVLQLTATKLSDIKRNRLISIAIPGTYEEDDFVASTDRVSEIKVIKLCLITSCCILEAWESNLQYGRQLLDNIMPTRVGFLNIR
jgi:hypothetical protein